MLIKYNNQEIKVSIHLPGSKSISNRFLILNEVLKTAFEFQNLSNSKDTIDLVLALEQIKTGKDRVIDIGHAGTDMRFLTALLSIKEGDWTLTGSERMKQRPIGELVEALRQLGAEINYLENDGFPPLKIKGKKLLGGKVEINADTSSQFISALLLISPALENGLEIHIKNKPVSWSYVEMTIGLLVQSGIKVIVNSDLIIVTPKQRTRNKEPETLINELPTPNSQLVVESDWSSASYWYSIVALSENAEIILSGLNEKSLQGDSVVSEIYKSLGVRSEFKDGNVKLSRTEKNTDYFEFDFIDCPDIAQTVAATCLGLKIDCYLKGLSTLKHKETDRLTALKNELQKFDATVTIGSDFLKLHCHNSQLPTPNSQLRTYDDHRMAMAFAPLVLRYGILDIENPEVVKKSYPGFWEDLKTVGIERFTS